MASKRKPPEISPFLFPAILAFFGFWCLYDGWFTTNPEMLEHQTFNRVASAILLPWALFDFIRTRKKEKERALRKKQEANDNQSTEETTPDND